MSAVFQNSCHRQLLVQGMRAIKLHFNEFFTFDYNKATYNYNTWQSLKYCEHHLHKANIFTLTPLTSPPLSRSIPECGTCHVQKVYIYKGRMVWNILILCGRIRAYLDIIFSISYIHFWYCWSKLSPIEWHYSIYHT